MRPPDPDDGGGPVRRCRRLWASLDRGWRAALVGLAIVVLAAVLDGAVL